jgi:hypothetical protein
MQFRAIIFYWLKWNYIYLCTVKLFSIFKVKNAHSFMLYIVEYVVYSLVSYCTSLIAFFCGLYMNSIHWTM